MMIFKEIYKLTKEKYMFDNKTIEYLFKYCFNNDNLSFDKLITKRDANKYIKLLDRLKSGEPIQYLVGNIDFYKNNFIVKKGVLIPRFETEELVYYTKQYIDQYFAKDISIIDIGTGTGVIGLSLKKELPTSNVTLVDISTKAIKLSKINASLLKESVKIYKSDIFKEVLNKKDKYDVIISNPPYISISEPIEEIVKNHEPSLALYGGLDGLKFYKKILKDVKKVSKDKFLIAFEIGETQSLKIKNLVSKYLPDANVIVKKDLSKRDRMMFIFYNVNM